jgi:hypothetical protein
MTLGEQPQGTVQHKLFHYTKKPHIIYLVKHLSDIVFCKQSRKLKEKKSKFIRNLEKPNTLLFDKLKKGRIHWILKLYDRGH